MVTKYFIMLANRMNLTLTIRDKLTILISM
ncbi:hypothetical protein PPOLYM_03011 [Paenibacillus polymyxa]|nr:hypothetical protein PPOLYM_03011 [Paenibacillus polymyxa]